MKTDSNVDLDVEQLSEMGPNRCTSYQNIGISFTKVTFSRTWYNLI